MRHLRCLLALAIAAVRAGAARDIVPACASAEEQASLLQTQRLTIAVCGNYVGPDFCNGEQRKESTCFPRKHTDTPFSDRAPPRDCADSCAQMHDYCCHNSDYKCGGCVKSPWSRDCTGHLESCLRSCREKWRSA